ncbi:MAG: citrate (Si)-synthase, partial [Deltaproteobacteria bacterium]|nr:citrate (Si)-synthase [Deltaproteobacteria bacterium]
MEDVCKPMLNTGLRGVVIADTRISDVQGAAGKLIYRGYLIQDLANNATFEEVAFLLLFEKLPNAAELKAFKNELAAERDIPQEVIAALKTRPKDALVMDVLQAGVSLLANHDPDIKDQSQEAAVRMALRMIAKFPTLLAAWDRIRNDKQPLKPSPKLDHAANFLYMLKGEEPDEEESRFMDV